MVIITTCWSFLLLLLTSGALRRSPRKFDEVANTAMLPPDFLRMVHSLLITVWAKTAAGAIGHARMKPLLCIFLRRLHACRYVEEPNDEIGIVNAAGEQQVKKVHRKIVVDEFENMS
ncbi:hypothetical protein CISG_00068 [Coccidioides immitis RMSCC 3703]|uniref:Secreted protein n=1 Tax=Coccidioides immitis RMSCC 3703 TaxID=454286 RepID=A0A0J8QKP8_COCIT|nr:hypothetical protein CISG_00068 [Coccidioides immitis RMSCC 3703]